MASCGRARTEPETGRLFYACSCGGSANDTGGRPRSACVRATPGRPACACGRKTHRALSFGAERARTRTLAKRAAHAHVAMHVRPGPVTTNVVVCSAAASMHTRALPTCNAKGEYETHTRSTETTTDNLQVVLLKNLGAIYTEDSIYTQVRV